jgi:protein-tyrosine phosphatase
LAVSLLYGRDKSLSPFDSVSISLLIPKDSSISPDTRPASDPFTVHTGDSSIPFPTMFAWSSHGTSGPLSYAMSLSEDSVFTASDLVADKFSDTFIAIWNLMIGTPYYWKVCASDSHAGAWCSQVFSLKTPDLWPRVIFVDGTTNARDIGGRRNMDGVMIRQGLFYRSAELNQNYTVTEKGIRQLMQLGIVLDIDLRNQSEHARPALPAPVRYFHPISDSGAEIIAYLPGLVTTPGLYRDVFKVLADARNYPLICHCLAGADRTATVAALLEALLGNSQQQIGDDYQWTSLSVNGVRDTNSINWKNTITFIRSFDRQNGTVQAGAWNYLQTIGMTVDELMAIRKLFLGDNRQPFPNLSAYLPASPAKPAHLPRKYVLYPSRNAILIERGMNRAVVFNLAGKKLFDGTFHTAADMLWKIPTWLGHGVHVLFVYGQTAQR